jgi:phage terminase large subunit
MSKLWLPDGFDWKAPDYTPVYERRMTALQRLREDPSLIPSVKAFYADDHPAEFIHDWGMTFDPRAAERKLPTTMPFLLFPKQDEFIKWLLGCWRNREDGLAEKSRDMGVSWLCVAFATWMWLFQPGIVAGFGSRKEEYVDDLNDPKSLFWKARNFIGLLPVEFQPAGWNPKKHAPFMSLVNPENGSAIVGEAGDNIGRGNRTSIYFKDESAFYEHPDTIDAALSQTSNCKIDVSTPNGEGNPFARKRRAAKVRLFTFHWKQDPRKGQEWYDKQKRDLDEVVLAQEVEISYSASVANAYVPSAYVVQAMSVGPGGCAACRSRARRSRRRALRRRQERDDLPGQPHRLSAARVGKARHDADRRQGQGHRARLEQGQSEAAGGADSRRRDRHRRRRGRSPERVRRAPGHPDRRREQQPAPGRRPQLQPARAHGP